MGVNKNISILMLFDCVLVNTGLGSHCICNSGKQGVYMWIDDVINLEPFFSFWPVDMFSSIKNDQQVKKRKMVQDW